LRESDISPIRAEEIHCDNKSQSRTNKDELNFDKASSGIAEDIRYLIPITEEQTTFLENSTLHNGVKHKTVNDVNRV